MDTSTPHRDKNKLYAGIVWILSAFALGAYGILLLTNTRIPGMEELMNFLVTIDTKYIYLAALVSIFIEGLYFIGSFFPGASLIIVLAIISHVNGLSTLFITLALIFLGWCAAGIINIYTAKLYRSKITKLQHSDEYEIKDHTWTTWFPAFRASHEVAQVIEGGRPIKVFLSSIRVRFWAVLFVGALAFIIPLFIDIKQTTNKEGFVVIITVIIINLVVGISKIRRYHSKR